MKVPDHSINNVLISWIGIKIRSVYFKPRTRFFCHTGQVPKGSAGMNQFYLPIVADVGFGTNIITRNHSRLPTNQSGNQYGNNTKKNHLAFRCVITHNLYTAT